MSSPAVNLNPARAQYDWPPAVVAGAHQTGVVLMRNLRRRGVRVSCFDCDPLMPGFKTVYGDGYLCPDPDVQPAEWVEFMIGLACKVGARPVLISCADQFVTAIAQHALALREHFIFLADSMATQDLLATKKRQYDIASRHGLQVPRTRFVRSWEMLRDFASEGHFPCLLKPVHCREWEHFPPGHPLLRKKTALAHDMKELEANYRLAESLTSELVVQEVVQGPDTAKLVYLSCYGRHGGRLGGCVVRELRTDPIYFGSASVVEPLDDAEANGLCDNFLRQIHYAGICEIELKRDSRTGEVKLIEANPRYSVTADAAPYMGLDLGWLHYLDLIGQPVVPVAASYSNLRHIVLRRDAACFRSYLAEGLCSWRDLIRSYRPPVAFYDFDLQDWRVTYDNLVMVLKMLAGPTYRRWFPKRSS